MNNGDIVQGMRCLLRHRLRTFLSTLGVLFGVVSVIAMLAIGEGSKQEILAQIKQLGTHNVIIRQSDLSEDRQTRNADNKSRGLSFLDALVLTQNISLIEKQACLKVLRGEVCSASRQISPEILAVNPTFREIKGLELSEGRFLGDFDLLKSNRVCVIGADIAARLGKWGHVGQFIRIENHQFQIVGVLRNKSFVSGKSKMLSGRNVNESILVPLGIEKGFAAKADSVGGSLSEIILQLGENSPIAMGAEAVKRMMTFRHKGAENYQIIIPHELLDQANQTQKIFNLVLGGIAALSMLVGGIGIMNVMLATISARTREIGIRRAVGANQYHIARQFLIETLILTLGGALLGLVGGIILSHLIGFLAGWSVIVTFWSVFLAVGMAVVVGIASGLYPAFKAASLDPIVALRNL